MRVENVKQGDHEWKQLRLGRITGTRLGDALGTARVQQTLLCELIAEQMTEQDKDFFTNASMERGQIEEAFACKEYEKRTGAKVDKLGFIVADHIDERIGFSPDGVVMENDTIIGGVEIKNPDSKTHVSYLIANDVPKDYFFQVIMAFMAIPTAQWWDFVSFDSRVKNPEKKMLIKRVYRKDIDLLEYGTSLKDFLTKWDDTYSQLVF